MAAIKKMISVIISASIILTLFTGAAAAANSSNNVSEINKMADALNKLNILQGQNGDYKLNDKTKRSEAATFIIRMLGKMDYVEQNSGLFKNTKFVDVLASKWYAPYVGYCSQNNILSGITNNTFAPDEYTTEKQFLKMALGALGYIEGTDFDWSNVYQKAYSVGIVTDISYISKTADNRNYLRSEAVKVIYRSLNSIKKGTQKKLAFILVDEGSYTADEIGKSGLVSDGVATVIDLITPTASDSIEVNLNENIQNVYAYDITIYDTVSTSNVLAVKTVTFKDDKIQVITSGQIAGRDYTVKINNVTDISGNISSGLIGSFKGYVKQEINSDFFRIKKVEQSSLNAINVYFTHPINSNSEVPAYYEVTKNGYVFIAGSSQNLSVKKLQTNENNSVSILLKNTVLTKGDVYGIKINGKLSSSYGAKLGDGSGDSMDFVAVSDQSGKFDVSLIQAISSTSVRILFNREIDKDWAGKRLNYTVLNSNKSTIDVTNAVVSESGDYIGREVILNIASSLDRTKIYELKIDFIPDVYKQSSIEGKSVAFPGAYPENSGVVLNKAVSDYNNCAVLIFNKAIDPVAAANKANYLLRGVNDSSINLTPEKAYYTEQYGQYLVKLFLPAGKTFIASQRYIVYATDLKDKLGNYQAMFSAEFTGGSSSIVKPQLIDAVTVAKDIIKLRFNTEIAFDVNNINTNNYSLEYIENGEALKMNPVGVTYIDPNTLVLKFDELDKAKAYQIKFNKINDYSGLYPRTASDGGNTLAVRWGK